MDAVRISSPSLDGQDVFIRFIPSGQTEYIDLGLQLLPYIFYYDQQVPPLPNEAGTFLIYCSGLQCTYEITIGDLPPCTPPNLGTSLYGGIGYEVSQNVYANYSSSTISISGSNITSGQSLGNVYSWYSGSTNITSTGNTQIISFNLSGYSYPMSIEFRATNNIGCPNTLPVIITYIIDPYIEILSTSPDTGFSDGTVTFRVMGGFPAPPYGSSESYFVFDPNYFPTNSTVTSTNVSQTFGNYPSGSSILIGSAYNYGGNPTTGFTIGYEPCTNPVNVPSAQLTADFYTQCEGSLIIFSIITDGTSWELYGPLGLYAYDVGPAFGYPVYLFPSMSDSGTWTLNTFNAVCSATTSVNITILGYPSLNYSLVSSSIVGNNNGFVEIGASNTNQIFNDLDFIPVPCCPAQFTNIPDGSFFSVYGNNSPCFFSAYLNAFNITPCFSLPSVNLSANTITVCSGGTLELAAFGGDTYQFFNILNGPSTFSSFVYGDPVTGATVTVTTNAQPGVHDGVYACQVTDGLGCQNYQTINISVIIC